MQQRRYRYLKQGRRWCEIMKKIGIITHYYNSKNYGGVLQAYALCQFLREQGYNAEQVQYDKESDSSIKHKVGNCYRYFLTIPMRIRHKKMYADLAARTRAFAEFRDKQIPHSASVFNRKSMNKLADAYDLYITGSDQVWHPNAVCDAYLLDFGEKKVKKMSYAASIAKEKLTKQELESYRRALNGYCAISVREKNAVDILQPISPVDVKWVLDPVFLLRKEEWLSMIQKKNNIDVPYVACYFLGSDKNERKLAKFYAESKNLKLVVFPFLSGNINDVDLDFGDESRIAASPTEFISVIQNAESVFTDSFHAMAFSLLFEKQVFVFERVEGTSMGSRIESLAGLFGITNHYCNRPEMKTSEYLSEVTPIDYLNTNTAFESKRNESMSFLMQNVRDCLKEDKQ